MATITLSSLKDRVAQKLRIVANGETVDANDLTLIEAKYDEIYDELNNLGRVDFVRAGPIGTTHSNHVIAIVAARCADDFEIPEPRLQRLMMEEEKALLKLKEVAHQAYIETQEAEYF